MINCPHCNTPINAKDYFGILLYSCVECRAVFDEAELKEMGIKDEGVVDEDNKIKES